MRHQENAATAVLARFASLIQMYKNWHGQYIAGHTPVISLFVNVIRAYIYNPTNSDRTLLDTLDIRRRICVPYLQYLKHYCARCGTSLGQGCRLSLSAANGTYCFISSSLVYEKESLCFISLLCSLLCAALAG